MNKEYCVKCGSEAIQTKIGAEKIRECGLASCFYPYHKYDYSTGEREYGTRVRCPNSKWYNFNHTDYTTIET